MFVGIRLLQGSYAGGSERAELLDHFEQDEGFVRADAKVFADGRLVLSCFNANVGCHKNIRYSDYPQMIDMGFGGKLKTRKD